jgi:hypothetical protein
VQGPLTFIGLSAPLHRKQSTSSQHGLVSLARSRGDLLGFGSAFALASGFALVAGFFGAPSSRRFTSQTVSFFGQVSKSDFFALIPDKNFE